jgi:hypothetical protein
MFWIKDLNLVQVKLISNDIFWIIQNILTWNLQLKRLPILYFLNLFFNMRSLAMARTLGKALRFPRTNVEALLGYKHEIL